MAQFYGQRILNAYQLTEIISKGLLQVNLELELHMQEVSEISMI